MTQAFNLAQLANNLNTSGQLDATDGLSGLIPIVNGSTGLTAPGTSGNVLTSDGTSWTSAPVGNAATVTNGVYTTNFTGSNQSVNSDGYQKLPGGLIIQWGTSGGISPNSTLTINYPISFPNAVFVITTGANTSNQQADGTTNVISRGTSSFVAANGDNANTFTCSWIAIGY